MVCAALYRMAREGLIEEEEVIIAQRPKEAGGMGHTGIWQKSRSGREKKVQRPQTGVRWAGLKDSKKAMWQKWGK